MAIKEETQELKEIEEKDQYERHDILAVEKSIPPEINSVQKTKPPSYLTCHECGKCFTLKPVNMHQDASALKALFAHVIVFKQIK